MPNKNDTILVYIAVDDDGSDCQWSFGKVRNYNPITNDIVIKYSDGYETKTKYSEDIMHVPDQTANDQEFYAKTIFIYSAAEQRWLVGVVGECDAAKNANIFYHDDGFMSEEKLDGTGVLFKLPEEFMAILPNAQIVIRAFAGNLTEEDRKKYFPELKELFNVMEDLPLEHHYKSAAATLPRFTKGLSPSDYLQETVVPKGSKDAQYEEAFKNSYVVPRQEVKYNKKEERIMPHKGRKSVKRSPLVGRISPDSLISSSSEGGGNSLTSFDEGNKHSSSSSKKKQRRGS